MGRDSHLFQGTVKQIDISQVPIDTLFRLAIQDFSLPDTCLKQLKKKSTASPFTFTLTLTSDLPVPIILNELQRVFTKYNIQIIAHERTINSESDIQLYSADYRLLLQAEVAVNKNASRNFGTIAFLVQGLDDIGMDEFTKNTSEIEGVTFLITPSKSNKGLMALFPEHDNDYLVQLSENIPDQEYKLKDDFSKKRIRQSIQSIFSTFGENEAYFVNSQSVFYHSLIFPYIERELSGKKLITEKALTIIPYQESEERFLESMNRILFSKALSKPVILTFDFKNYHLLVPHISRFIKKGGKIVKLHSLLSGDAIFH